MEGNKVFYIKYQDNQPEGVETHYYPDGRERKRLITSTSQLITTCATEPTRRLLGLPENFGPLTLHLSPNGPAIPGNALLNSMELSISHTVGSWEQPLIIRSLNETITMDEYMLHPLPHPLYDNCVSTPNASSSGRLMRPADVSLWADFEQTVVDWIDGNHLQHSQRVRKPVFVPRDISEEVPHLHPFIQDNLLNVAAKCFIPPSEFKSRRHTTNCVGEPDNVMVRDGEIAALFEKKGPWTLSDPDIVGTYHIATTASAVNQLYYYMRLNHRKYGILSSYENTWFVYRSQECSSDGPAIAETLYVSPGISYTNQNPTVLQCFSYFNSIVNADYMCSPPASKRTSRANSALQTSQTASPAISPSGSAFRGSGSPLSSEIPIHETSQNFDVDDFQFDTVLGEGRSKVYLDHYESNRIALKVADIAKHREMLPELLNEVSVYEQLSHLQGNGIPRLFCHGFVEEVLYCVGVSICGTIAESFTEQQKQKLMNILEKIHEIGILHNDIKKENILIDEHGDPCIIDFGFSTRNCSPVDQMEERNLLLRLVESN